MGYRLSDRQTDGKTDDIRTGMLALATSESLIWVTVLWSTVTCGWSCETNDRAVIYIDDIGYGTDVPYRRNAAVLKVTVYIRMLMKYRGIPYGGMHGHRSVHFPLDTISLTLCIRKTQNGRFRCKMALRLQKVCHKVSLCENCQRHWPNCPCKYDWWGTSPSKRKFGGYWPTRRFSIYFS